MKITYILPSRERPGSFFSALNNIAELSFSDNYHIIAALDFDDKSMYEPWTISQLEKDKKVTTCWGHSRNKVHAINREVHRIEEDTDIIILMSDDMEFTQKYFDEVIRDEMRLAFPVIDGVLHFNDGTPMADHVISLSIMGYKYFKEFGYLYYPSYMNVYADNEFTAVSKILRKYKYVRDKQIHIHKHPAWRTAKNDGLYIRNENPVPYQKDKELYFERLERNFELS